MPSFILGLVWKNPNGTFTEEPWQYFSRESLEDALTHARKDGKAGEFGRTFVGVKTVERADVELPEPWGPRKIAAKDAPKLAVLEAQLRGERVSPKAWAPTVLRAKSPAALEKTKWWKYECAFGTGTLSGVLLRECLAKSEKVALEAATVAGESIAHQSTLYEVTPHAVVAMRAMLPLVTPKVRKELQGWLEVITDAANAEAGPTPTAKELRATFVETGTPEFLIENLIARALTGYAAAKAIRKLGKPSKKR